MGFSIGLHPDEVLNMSMRTLYCCLAGYEDIVQDKIHQAIFCGYYSAYYQKQKRPKSPKVLITEMLAKRAKDKARGQQPEVDMEKEVALFEERDRKFRAALGGQ